MKPYYQDDSVTIFHGDNLEIISQLPKVDLIITDPPYGVNTKSDGMGKLSPWADLCNSAFWYSAWIKSCRDRLKTNGCLWSFLNWRSMVTFQKASCDIGWPIESMLVWDKCWIGPGGNIGLRPSYELIALFAGSDFNIENRGLPDIQRWKWSSQKPNGHPAEKPIDAMLWLINISGGDLIFDPFMGSGTTLRAAKNMGRKAIGIEIEERYCEIAAKRMSQECLNL